MTLTTILSKASLFKRRKRDLSVKSNEESSFLALVSLSDTSNEQGSHAAEIQQRREMECLLDLKEGCRLANIQVSDNTIFRFAAYYDFDYDRTRTEILQRHDDPHLHLRMEGEMMELIENMVLLPVPGLRTKNYKHEVIYFHAARFFPSETDTQVLIDNMCYIFNDMSLTEEQCRNGIAFIIDLNNWTFKNFTNECTNKFLDAMQQQVPTKVAAVFIVNAPKWFPKLWRHVLKKMLSKSFVRKFHILKRQSDLKDYLMPGYEKYLPQEMSSEGQDTTEIIEDFVDMKVHQETTLCR